MNSICNVQCLQCAIFAMCSVCNVQCLQYAVFAMCSICNVECLKCAVFAWCSVWIVCKRDNSLLAGDCHQRAAFENSSRDRNLTRKWPWLLICCLTLNQLLHLHITNRQLAITLVAADVGDNDYITRYYHLRLLLLLLLLLLLFLDDQLLRFQNCFVKASSPLLFFPFPLLLLSHG